MYYKKEKLKEKFRGNAALVIVRRGRNTSGYVCGRDEIEQIKENAWNDPDAQIRIYDGIDPIEANDCKKHLRKIGLSGLNRKLLINGDSTR